MIIREVLADSLVFMASPIEVEDEIHGLYSELYLPCLLLLGVSLGTLMIFYPLKIKEAELITPP